MTAPAKRRKPRPRNVISKTERNERAARALMMRNSGATYTAIAERIGYSEQSAKNDVTRAIKEWVRIPAEQMVDRQRAILLDIVRVEFPDAMDRTVEAEKRHAAQAKIIECLRDERQLFGLNAPQKISLGISAEEFAQQARDLLAVTGPRPLLELTGEVVDADEDDDWDAGDDGDWAGTVGGVP